MNRFLKLAAIFALVFVPSICLAGDLTVDSVVWSGVTTVARGLPTIAADVHKVKVGVRGGSISCFANGETPTATDGFLLNEGAVLTLEGQDEITKFRAVMASGENGVALSDTETGVSMFAHPVSSR